MMNRSVIYSLMVVATVISCTTADQSVLIEQAKKAIVSTEQEFAEKVAREGVRAGFLEFAAPDAVLMRNDSLIIGKESITRYMKEPPTDGPTISLSWKPDFVAVAGSGDLGYTYGKYVLTATDSLGTSEVNEGIFHTVWKKQPDGKWRFVWD